MRITLVISSLASGGAERVMSIMADYWAKKKWPVTLITLYPASTDFYRLHPGVKRVALGMAGDSRNPLAAAVNNIKRISRLRGEIKRSMPDAVIAFGDRTNVLTLIATRGLGLKVTVSERTDPATHSIGRIWSWLRKNTYPMAGAIAVQSAGVGRWVEKTIGKNGRVAVIANPVNNEKNGDKRTLADVIGKSAPSRTIIAMGRLGHEKGFDLLLQAFARISRKNPEWKLVIFGEGGQRENMSRLAKELDISDRVYMPGLIKDPAGLLRQADIFVMSSRYEGFPNALLEAMASGLPVISFDCPSGPAEIIRDGIDGLLAPAENVDALAQTMERLMRNEAERKRLGAVAVEVKERFNIEKIMRQWEKTVSH